MAKNRVTNRNLVLTTTSERGTASQTLNKSYQMRISKAAQCLLSEFRTNRAERTPVRGDYILKISRIKLFGEITRITVKSGSEELTLRSALNRLSLASQSLQQGSWRIISWLACGRDGNDDGCDSNLSDPATRHRWAICTGRHKCQNFRRITTTCNSDGRSAKKRHRFDSIRSIRCSQLGNVCQLNSDRSHFKYIWRRPY